MPQSIFLPDGTEIQDVPDNATDAQIAEIVRRVRASMQPRRDPDLPPESEAVAANAAGVRLQREAQEPRTPEQVGREQVRNMSASEGRREAVAAGLGSGLFGIDRPISAGVEFIEARSRGRPVTFSQILEQVQGRRDEAADRFPEANVPALAAGIGGTIAATPARATQFVTQAPGRISQLLRGSAAAGTAAGTQALLEGNDPATAAAVGVVAAPVALTGADAAIRGGRAVTDRVTGAVQQRLPGIRRLAERIGESPDALLFRFEQLRQQLGRNPSLSEIVGDQDAVRVGALASSRPEEIGVPLQRQARERSIARQDEVAERVRGGRPPLTPEGARVRRTLFTNEQFRRFENDPIVLTGEVTEFLNDPRTIEAIPVGALPGGADTGSSLRSRLLRAAGGDDDVVITARDLENLRLGASSRNFRDVAEEARRLLGAQIPELEPLLQSFARRSQRIEGIETGPALVREGRSRSPVPGGREQSLEDVVERGRPAEQAGVRRGAREDIARRAENSPGGANEVVRSLAEDSAPNRRLEQVLPAGEGRDLQNFARAEQQATRSLNTMARGGSPSLLDEAERLVVEASQIPRGGGAFAASFAVRLKQFLGMSDEDARRISRALTNPDRTEQAIAEIQRLGATAQQIEQMLTQAGIAAGLSTTAVQ